jgi:hypothetical protein
MAVKNIYVAWLIHQSAELIGMKNRVAQIRHGWATDKQIACRYPRGAIRKGLHPPSQPPESHPESVGLVGYTLARK